MSLENLAESLGEKVERRGFLKRAGVAALGAVGFAGLVPGRAAAYATHGCNLCQAPNACGPRLQCAWCWTSNCSGGHFYSCCEGRQEGGNCNSSACPSYSSYFTGPIGNC